jgi:hypothetical protein
LVMSHPIAYTKSIIERLKKPMAKQLSIHACLHRWPIYLSLSFHYKTFTNLKEMELMNSHYHAYVTCKTSSLIAR